MKRTFKISAKWDDEANVFYSESDIKGFHIEAANLDEFEKLIQELALELIVINHFNLHDLVEKPMVDLIPTILWSRPSNDKDLAVA